MASGQRRQKNTSVLTVRTAISGVLVDEGFAIPTEEIKKCLSIARSLIKHFNSCDQAKDKACQARQSCEKFCSWLVDALEDIIGKSKKRNGVINSEKLWSSYHKLTTSTDFRTGWEGFLKF